MVISLAAAAPKKGVFIFAPEMMWDCIFIAILFALVAIMIQRARAGLPIPPIRRIAGLEAIDEAIGRATEMGKPVHYSPGMSGFAPETYAGLATLSYVAKMAAQYDTRLIVTIRRPQVHPVAAEIVKQAYLEAGRPDAYNPEDVRFVSDWQFSYTAAVMGIFQREKPAANLMIGYWMAEALVLAEAGAQAGCIQIGANTNVFQIHFFIVTCDYTLIGEELFAASAYLSREPMLTGTVVAQDIVKILIGVLIIIGTIWATATGSPAKLVDFLSL
ncbi:MAG TPA: hypothetical protein GXX30_02525 [Firmicutes bacterium]|uniref:DUF6754 domain-containing protein n=1 Tax=Candidatus Fermentithermobacillus carboniphilus TaxID=3085328 RepID=A0AAT9LGU9_9FIRM|nr:MAG: hypothetical protein IMF26_05295 [Candidatus Fermentithermobacillus carboniphilus]HHW17762.1 hypothetical protein [Candidatus Fermentithermobacillaceae bacterium]